MYIGRSESDDHNDLVSDPLVVGRQNDLTSSRGGCNLFIDILRQNQLFGSRNGGVETRIAKPTSILTFR